MAWPIRSAKAVARAALVVACGFAGWRANAVTLKAFVHNAEGLRHYKDKLFFESYQDFLKALEEEPLNPDLQMNLGLTFAQNEEWDKAEKAFLSAYGLAKGDKQREFMALFNIAVMRGQKSDIDGALQAYQAALEIEPESLEVKTNIELLFQGQGKGNGKSGNQGGKGDDKDDSQKQNKDQKDKNDGKDNKDNKDKQYQQPKKQPNQFQSKDLNKEDVRKILDEIQNQEQSIRAKEYDKGAKERKNDKDW